MAEMAEMAMPNNHGLIFGGFLSHRATRLPLVIIHFNRRFPNKNHPAIKGYPYGMETSMENSDLNVRAFTSPRYG
jgi:hypothetical protein